MTSVATISPVSLSLIAFIIIGPSDRSLRILSMLTSFSIPSSRGFSSGTDMSIWTSPDLILCMTLEEEHETEKNTARANNILRSEHIGQRYHKVVRQKKELVS